MSRAAAGAAPAAGPDGRPRAPRAVVAREPFLTRTLAPFELVTDEGLAHPRAQRRHDPRGGRHRGPRPPGRASTSSAARAPTSTATRVRFPRGLCRQIVQATAPRDVHPARAQPRARRADRRRRHRVRAELRLAVRARPRPRPALRDARGLRELREARVRVAEPAPLGRHRVRAGRRPGEQAPPRHGVRPPPLQRQAVHGLGHRRQPRRGQLRAGAHRVRRRPRRPHRDDEPHQRVVAARVGRLDARGGAGLRRAQPGDDHHAVHPRRRDGARPPRPRSPRRRSPRRSRA